MKVILTETGGFMGRTKIAEAEWPCTEKDFEELLKLIRIPKAPEAKDAISYFIKTRVSDKDIPVSIRNIPADYISFFDELFRNLKVID